MNRDWQRRSVADLIAEGIICVGDGYRAKLEELGASGLPFARAGNIDAGFHFEDSDRFPEHNLRRVGDKVSRPGDVVFTSKGTVGRFAFVRETTDRFVYSPQLCFWRVLRPGHIDPRFLFYWMFGREFYLQYKGVAGQTDMAEYVNLADQRRMHITLPPLADQRAIAQILSRLDDRIELNWRMNGTLETMAHAIFKSWFVDFDPVSAKAAGREPFGVDVNTAALFPNSFQESTIGNIPRGWDVGPITGRANLLSGGTPKTERKEYWNGDILWASAKDVSQCPQLFLLETERTITGTGLAESATQLVPTFCTVVVARGATTGRMVLLGREMAMNQTCYALVTTTNSPFWLHCLLRYEIGELVHAGHGSVFDTITTSTFASSSVVLPPQAVIEAFEVLVTPFFQRILAATIEGLSLTAIRDAVLPRLISGEIRINDAQRFVEASK
jgi:type I restriction enzyme S subunit